MQSAQRTRYDLSEEVTRNLDDQLVNLIMNNHPLYRNHFISAMQLIIDGANIAVRDYLFLRQLAGYHDWYEVDNISQASIDILKAYKNKLKLVDGVSPNNYLLMLDPRTPIGQLVWAQTGNKTCTLFNGTRLKMLNRLAKFGLSQAQILQSLAAIGVKIDSNTGVWLRSSNKQTQFNISMDEGTLKNYALDAKSLEYVNTLIEKFKLHETIDFNTYWQQIKNSFIHSAVENGYILLMQKLIQHDPSLLHARKPFDHWSGLYRIIEHGKYDTTGYHLLHTAVMHGQSDVLVFLLEQGCHVNTKALHTGDTPLHIAASLFHTQFVSLLLKNGASVHLENKMYHTPLDEVSSADKHQYKPDITLKLLAYGSSIPHMYSLAPTGLLNSDLYSLLKKAQATAPTCMMELTIALMKAYIKSKVFANNNPQLIDAKNFLDWMEKPNRKFEEVISHAAELMTKNSMKNSTNLKAILNLISHDEFTYFLAPVTEAVKQQRKSSGLVGYFFENKQPAPVKNIPDENMLLELAGYESREYIKNFIERADGKISPSYWHANKNKLVHCLVEGHHFNLLEKLINDDRDLLNIKLKNREPIYTAVVKDNGIMVKFLLNLGANVNSFDDSNRTLLHVAVDRDNLALVDLLLQYGAKLSCSDNIGTTPLDHLVYIKHTKQTPYIIAKLIAYGERTNTFSSIYVDLSNSPVYLRIHELESYLVEAQKNKSADANIVDLTQLLLKAYINSSFPKIHPHIKQAKDFLVWIQENSYITFAVIQEKARDLLEEPFMKDSKTFKLICELIADGKEEFSYFLAPRVKKPGIEQQANMQKTEKHESAVGRLGML